MRSQWVLSFDGGDTYSTTAVPVNDGDVKFERTQDLNAGQIFFRRFLRTELRFQDLYSQLWTLRKGVFPCDPIYIRRQYYCSGVWKTYWTGVFSPAECSFDHDRCEVRILPKVFDKYSCILDQRDNRVNVLWVEPETVMGRVSINIEWGIHGYHDNFGCVYEYDYPPPNQGGGGSWSYWALAHTHSFTPSAFQNFQWDIYWREVVTTECVNGVGIPPAGTGWAVLYDNCTLNGTVTWWREPITPYTYGDSFTDPTNCGSGLIKTVLWPGGPVQSFSPGCSPVPVEIAARYICVPDDMIEFQRARNLEDVINYLLERSGCGGSVRSDFFEWDAPMDTPGYVGGVNYITGETNQVNALYVLQKSDATNPGASTPAAIGEWTFSDVMAALNTMFQVFWDIDDDGNLRIEHWYYWTLVNTTDITDATAPNTLQSTASTVPKIERLRYIEAGLKDFIGADIIYTGECTSDEVVEYTLTTVTTDLSFVITDPNSIDKQRGFVMLATELDGSTIRTIEDVGALSLSVVTNAPLSVANLEADYWTWNRYLPTGTMNTRDATFDGVRPNMEQQDVVIPLCCTNLSFDPRNAVETSLGNNLLGGRLGTVVSVNEEERTSEIKLNVRYYV